jgi:hypothetical protein
MMMAKVKKDLLKIQIIPNQLPAVALAAMSKNFLSSKSRILSTLTRFLKNSTTR